MQRRTQRHQKITVETARLKSDQTGYDRASTILADGGLVAFPTETVYGLGADARNDVAVARIFEAKVDHDLTRSLSMLHQLHRPRPMSHGQKRPIALRRHSGRGL